MGPGWSDIARDDRANVIPNGEDHSDGTAAFLAPLVNPRKPDSLGDKSSGELASFGRDVW
jgi:hypothetical protein